MTITVSIVEDNSTYRSTLEDLIRTTDGLQLVSTYANGEEAGELLSLRPDVVLVDILLPGMNGAEFIKKMKPQNEAIQYLVCTGFDDDDKIFSALESGATGYILKNYTSAEITRAILDIYHGGVPMSPAIARRVISTFQNRNGSKVNLLTDREKEILEFASDGLMYKEIGEELEITYETVKRHMKNIFTKLQVQNKIEAINKYKNK